jgi:nitroreductase
MDLDRAIMERRSRRKFGADPVSENDVQALCEAVRAAPSWANTQCVSCMVIRDSATKDALVETMSEKNPACKAMAQAPVTLVLVARLGVSGHKGGKPVDDKSWYMFDTGLAMQNLCLKAHAMGLGTVIVGFFDHRKAAEILAVPEGFEVVAFTPVGIPEGAASSPKRRDLGEIVHLEKWSRKD